MQELTILVENSVPHPGAGRREFVGTAAQTSTKWK